MVIPPVVSVVGQAVSGRRRLLGQLVTRLGARGLRVGVIEDGALSAGDGSPEPLLADLVGAFCRGCDVVLAEGGRSHDKILTCPPGQSARAPRGDGVRVVVAEDDGEAAFRWLLAWLRRRRAAREGVVAAVLAGGSSRRMGADKSRLSIAGRRVLGRLCELLADRIGEVMVVGSEPDRQGVPSCVRWQADAWPGLGPLGGVATALAAAGASGRAKAVCVVACDMPLVGGELVDHLLAGRDRAAAATVAWNPATGRSEPLLAIYEPRALPSIQRALRAGELSVAGWLASAGPNRLALPEELTGQLANVNTPEELRAVASQAGRAGW